MDKLGSLGLVAFLLNSIIGGGIFSLPQNMAVSAAPAAILTAWLITGAGTASLALVFQKLAIQFPQLKGGIYSYARTSFGPYVGLQTAWVYWISAWIGNVSYLILLGSALSFFFPCLEEGNTLEALVVSSTLLWCGHLLALRGVKSIFGFNAILSLLKLLLLGSFIYWTAQRFNMELFFSDIWGQRSPPLIDGTPIPSFWNQTKASMLITMWVFVGLEGASTLSRHASHPERIGKSMLVALAIALLLYLLVSLLPLGCLPRSILADLKNPSMAGVLETTSIGRLGRNFVALGVILSASGALLAWILFAAEIPFLVAKDQKLFNKLSTLNANGAPSYSLWLTNGAAQLMLFWVYQCSWNYTILLTLATSAIVFSYFLVALASLTQTLKAPNRSWKGILLDSCAVFYTAWICYASSISGKQALLLFFPSTFLYFVHLYCNAKKARRNRLF